MRLYLAFVTACSTLLLLAGCGDSQEPGSDAASASSPTTTMDEAPMTAAVAEALDQAVAAVFDANTRTLYPGLWLGVWDDAHGAYVKAWGQAEQGGAEATVDDVLRIGSVTKSVTATVLLQLVGEGRAGLDDAVSAVAPTAAGRHPEVADLTLRQLLGMSSGLPDYMNVPDSVMAAVSADPDTVWTSDQLIEAGVSGGVQPPGTAGYSTTNYIVAQQVVEEVTGTPLRDVIAERVAGPLSMTTFALPPDDDTTLPGPASHGYLNTFCVAEVENDGGTATEGQDVSDWNASYGQGGGGMHATVIDLGRWGASGLGDALLTADLAAQRADFTALPEGISYGLGLADYGGGFLGHSGEAIGWQAQVTHNADTGTTIALGTNACAGADSLLFDRIRSSVAQVLHPAGVASGAAAPSAS